jgi:hypothetical protein
MSKLLSVLIAGATALVMSGTVFAADDSQSGTQSSDPTMRNDTPDQAGQPANDEDNRGVESMKSQPGGEVSAQEQEYLAALKKCESLEGDQKQECIDAAKKKAGEM